MQIVGEADASAVVVKGPRIGIAVGKGEGGKLALKWALEKVIPPEALVCLLHVQTPLRLIPNGIGGKYPIENVSPVTVKEYKEQLFLEIDKIMKECRMLCDKKKVKSEVYYVECSSVQKGLVDQVYKLTITSLVLGKSSQNALSRALKKDIPTSVAKHSPKFCTVMVVCKGKLCYLQEATTQSPTLPSTTRTSNVSSISERSEISVWSADTNSEELMTTGGIQVKERKIDEGSSSRPYCSPSLDFSQGSSPLGLSRSGSNVENESSAVNSLPRNQSIPFEARLCESVATAFHQPDDNNAHFTPRFGGQASEAGSACSAEESFRADTHAHMHEFTIPRVPPADSGSAATLVAENQRSQASEAGGACSAEERFRADTHGHVHEPPADPGSAATSVAENQSIYMTMDDSQIILYPSLGALSQMSMDIGTATDLSSIEGSSVQRPLSIIEGSSVQRPLHVQKSVAMGTDMTFAKNEGILNSEFYMLLNEAKQSSDAAQREAQRQAMNLRMTEEVIASFRKMLAEHERRRDEALEEAKSALRDQEILEKRVAEEVQRHQETRTEVETLRSIVAEEVQRHQETRTEVETLKRMVAEEVQRHQETHTEVETLKRMADNYAIEADLAKQEAETLRKRRRETLLKLEAVTMKLELECQLRKEAEEKASQEALVKQDAIMALRKEQQKFSQYSFQELQTATNHFHEENKLGEGGYGPVYRGKLYHTTVAIKVPAREGALKYDDEFQKKVEFISRIHHPHMVLLLGACPEEGCLVYEYMANGSLEDRLNCKDGTPPLPWFVRFRICLEVATALLFLHSRPEPIIHRDLKPANILLNHHFVSKIGDAGLAKLVPNNVTMHKESILVGTFAYIDPDYLRTGVISRESDVYSLGIVMLQLLTGKSAVGVADLVEKAVDIGQLESVLDRSAGEWPLSEAMALACLSMECAEPKGRHRPNLETKILPALETIQSVAGMAAANMACVVPSSFGTKPITPSFFFCPISQEIMENPHMAADGFTYEHDAIKAWLQGHDTSPMTNLTLNHKNLIPNHTLRSTIKEWYDNGLIA